jgi:hypothetical protein
VFGSDGRYTTCWVALADANSSNSCLMVVPRAFDPGYLDGDRGRNPLSTIFATPSAFQAIRPLPCDAGGMIAFTHRLMHVSGAQCLPTRPWPRCRCARIARFDEELMHVSAWGSVGLSCRPALWSCSESGAVFRVCCPRVRALLSPAARSAPARACGRPVPCTRGQTGVAGRQPADLRPE